MQPTSITIPAFNSSTGAGTLSSIAAEHGISVEDILGANKGNIAAIPDPANPNVIRAGASLNIPKPSVIQTTTSARTDFQTNGAKVTDMANRSAMANNNAQVSGANGNQNTQGQNGDQGNNNGAPAPEGGKDGTVSIVKDIQNLDGTRTVSYSDGTSSKVSVTKNADGTESYKEISGEGDVMSGIKSSIEDATAKASAQISMVHSTLESIRTMTDTATANLVSGLQQMYAARISAVQDSYKRLGASRGEEGFRTGLTRYAPDQEEGILTTTEVEGNMRVAKLQGDMMAAIGKAQMAQSDSDLKSFNEEWNKIDAINKEMGSEITNLYKQAVDKQNADLKASSENFKEATQGTKFALENSKRSAPGLADALSSFKSDDDKANFIATYAAKNGLDANVLWGDVTKAMTDEEKAKLNMANIRSTISNRAARLKLAQEKAGGSSDGTDTGTGTGGGTDTGTGTGAGDGGGTKAKYTITMSTDLASQFEKVGLKSDDIINLQESLKNGNDIDTVLSKAKGLNAEQKKLIKSSVKAVK